MNNLSEEEKKAIEYLKENSKEGSSFWCYEAIPNIKKVLKLIDKQQKEIEQEKEKNKELEATLKQTQDSWYEDTKKIELNNECEIALNNRIIDLENELNKEKEKNNRLVDKTIKYDKTLENLQKNSISKYEVGRILDKYSESSLMLNDTFIDFEKDLLGEEHWQY